MAKLYEGDYRFPEAALIRGYDLFDPTALHSSIKGIYIAYLKNLARVRDLGGFPVELAYWSNLLAANGPVPPMPHQMTPPWQDGAESQEEMEEQFMRAELAAMNEHFADQANRRRVNERNAMDAAWRSGVVCLKIVASNFPERTSWATQGTEAVLYAMVLGGYAAFEAYATDLWLATVNADWRLAKALLDGKHRKKGQTDDERKAARQSQKDREERVVRLTALGAKGFDLSKGMGTFLEKHGIVDFKSLDGIRQAYQDAFGTEAEEIFDRSPFLRLAEKTRHLIAHRSGLIDETYSKQVKQWPDFGNDQVGEYLSLNGVIVANLLTATAGLVPDLAILAQHAILRAEGRTQNESGDSGPGTGDDVPGVQG